MSSETSRKGAAVYVYLILVMATWSSAIILNRAMHEIMPPVAVSFWRWAIMAVVLYVLVRRRLAAELPFIRAQAKQFAVMAALLVGATTLTIIAVNFTTAINVTLVNASQPTATVFIAWLLLRDRLRPVQAAGVIAAITGIVVMISKGDLAVLAGLELNPGDFWMLVAVLGYATYAVRLRRLPGEVSQLTVLFIVSVFGIIALAPIYALETIFVRPMPFQLETVLAVFYLATIPSLFSMYLWQISIKKVGVNRAAVFINLMPVFSAIMAVALLGEQIFAFHFIGSGFVAAGIFLVVRGGAGQKRQ